MAKIIVQGKASDIIGKEIKFTPEDDAPAVYYLAGSAFTGEANKTIGISAFANDQLIISSQVFSNQSQTHRATVPSMAEFTMPMSFEITEDADGIKHIDENANPNEVTIVIKNLNDDTATDFNDFVVFARL